MSSAPLRQKAQVHIAAKRSQIAELTQTPYVKVRSEPMLMIAITGVDTGLRPPAGLSGKPPAPAPAVVKGPACGPLRALDNWGRRRRPAITTGGLTPQDDPPCSVSTPLSRMERILSKAETWRPISRPSFLQHCFVVWPTITADRDDDA
jgi:hypothetical protein